MFSSRQFPRLLTLKEPNTRSLYLTYVITLVCIGSLGYFIYQTIYFDYYQSQLESAKQELKRVGEGKMLLVQARHRELWHAHMPEDSMLQALFALCRDKDIQADVYRYPLNDISSNVEHIACSGQTDRPLFKSSLHPLSVYKNPQWDTPRLGVRRTWSLNSEKYKYNIDLTAEIRTGFQIEVSERLQLHKNKKFTKLTFSNQSDPIFLVQHNELNTAGIVNTDHRTSLAFTLFGISGLLLLLILYSRGVITEHRLLLFGFPASIAIIVTVLYLLNNQQKVYSGVRAYDSQAIYICLVFLLIAGMYFSYYLLQAFLFKGRPNFIIALAGFNMVVFGLYWLSGGFIFKGLPIQYTFLTHDVSHIFSLQTLLYFLTTSALYFAIPAISVFSHSNLGQFNWRHELQNIILGSLAGVGFVSVTQFIESSVKGAPFQLFDRLSWIEIPGLFFIVIATWMLARLSQEKYLYSFIYTVGLVVLTSLCCAYVMVYRTNNEHHVKADEYVIGASQNIKEQFLALFKKLTNTEIQKAWNDKLKTEDRPLAKINVLLRLIQEETPLSYAAVHRYMLQSKTHADVNGLLPLHERNTVLLNEQKHLIPWLGARAPGLLCAQSDTLFPDRVYLETPFLISGKPFVFVFENIGHTHPYQEQGNREDMRSVPTGSFGIFDLIKKKWLIDTRIRQYLPADFEESIQNNKAIHQFEYTRTAENGRYVVIERSVKTRRNLGYVFAVLVMLNVFIFVIVRLFNQRVRKTSFTQLNTGYVLLLIVVSFTIIPIFFVFYSQNRVTQGKTQELLARVFMLTKQEKIRTIIDLLQKNEVEKAQNLLTVNREDYSNLFQVFDQNGQSLIATPTKPENIRLATGIFNYERLLELRKGAAYSKQIMGKHLSIAVPAMQSDIVSLPDQYYIHYVFPYFAEEVQEVLVDTIMVTLIFLFCVFVSVFVLFESSRLSLHYKFTRLKEKLQEVMKSGEPEHINWEKQDEIGELVHAINHFNLQLFRQMENKDALLWDKRYEDVLKSFYHDFKNPIAITKAMIDNFRRKLSRGVRDEDIHAFLSLLDDNALNTVNKIEALRDYYVEGRFKETLVADWINKFLDICKTKYPNISFELYNTNQRPLYIKMRSFELDLVLSNIIQNAVKVLANRPDPEIVIKISEATKISLVGVRISIYDNGPGIPEELQPILLRRYIDNPNSGGWGTGMYLAARNVTKYRGEIWFETEINVGTVFHIELPTIKESVKIS